MNKKIHKVVLITLNGATAAFYFYVTVVFTQSVLYLFTLDILSGIISFVGIIGIFVLGVINIRKAYKLFNKETVRKKEYLWILVSITGFLLLLILMRLPTIFLGEWLYTFKVSE